MKKEYKKKVRYYAYIPDKDGNEPPLYAGDSIRFDSVDVRPHAVMGWAAYKLGTERVVLKSYKGMNFHKGGHKLILDHGKLPLGERKKS